jgi:hypothetical protein
MGFVNRSGGKLIGGWDGDAFSSVEPPVSSDLSSVL